MQNFIGNNIHALRVNKGLSQTEFAKITGVSQSAISAWERGESTPHAQHVQALIEAIPKLVPDDIMSEELGYAKKILLHPNTRKEDVIDVPLFWFNCSGRTFGNAYNRRTISTPSIDSSKTSARFFP